MNVFQQFVSKVSRHFQSSFSSGTAKIRGSESYLSGNADASFMTEYVQKAPKYVGPIKREKATRKIICIGLFDGHGKVGGEAARLAAKETGEALERMLTEEGIRNLRKVIQLTFMEVTQAFEESPLSRRGGCTGSIVLVTGRKVVMGHIGDSTITLWGTRKTRSGKDPHLVHMSDDHLPKNRWERPRVQRAGGYIRGNYIMAKKTGHRLAVTRAFGDREFRKCGCISEPEIVERRMRKGDTLVIASDWLWDEVAICPTKVQECIRKLSQEPQQLAKELASYTIFENEPFEDVTVMCLTRM